MVDCGAEDVLNLLRYGAPLPDSFGRDASATATVIAPFLPALALAAHDSSAVDPRVLSALACHPDMPCAFAYAGLGYGESFLSRIHETLGSAEEPSGNRAGDAWAWSDDGEDAALDECDVFQQGDETERVNVAVISLHRRAALFDARWAHGGSVEELKFAHHEEETEGSIWSNKACLSELLYLLPIVTSRCPTLLTPEILIKGLLTARHSRLLLVTTLANNSNLVDRGAHFLCHILRMHTDISEVQPNSPHLQDHTAKNLTGLPRQYSGPATSQIAIPHIEHADADAAALILIKLCQIAPSLASVCREALVNTRSLVELALQITVEIIHDELEFLSRLIFSREATSQWILHHVGARQKFGESLAGQEHKIARWGVSDSSRHKEKEGSVARIREALLADARRIWHEDGWGGRLHSHLRLYCVLVRAGELSPTHEEVDFWLKALGNSSRDTGYVSVRTLQLGMAFVCLVSGLAGPSTKNLFHSAISCLLKAATDTNKPACTPANVELAVWLAVQLLLRKFAEIAMLVREAVGMHVTVQFSLMRDVAEAASGAGIITDASLVATVVANLRPSTPIVANKKQADLALKCIDQLMNTNTFNFSRYGVDVSDTLMHCLSLAQTPIHPVLPQLVQTFADMSATAPRARGAVQPFKMRPFPRDWLVAAIAPTGLLLSGVNASANIKSPGVHYSRHKVRVSRIVGTQSSIESHSSCREGITVAAIGDPLATAALAVYYILCREQIFRNIGIDGGVHGWDASHGDTVEEGNWTELLACLPLRPLIRHMEEQWLSYENLLPQVLAVASVVLPERFLASALLEDSEIREATFTPLVEGVAATSDLTWAGPFTTNNDLTKSSIEDSVTTDVNSGDQSMAFMDAMASVLIEEDSKVTLESIDVVVKTMKNALSVPLPALRVLHALNRTSTRWGGISRSDKGEVQLELGAKVWEKEAAVVRELVPLLLDSKCSRLLQETFCSWWRLLPAAAKEYLTPLLVSSLRDPTETSNGLTNVGSKKNTLYSQKIKDPQLVSLSSSGLHLEPLSLLACSPKVFRTPMLGVVLDLLLELLTSSRRICLAAATEGGRDGGIKREEVALALAAQDSAACQILLETCLPVTEMEDELDPRPLLEARSLICATISSLIHTTPLLLKLLHFQGYEPSLVPMMVEGVPSMVQCLEFVGELMQQPSQQCQVFAVILTAHIVCSHSSLPQSLSAAQQVVAHVSHVRSKVAGCARYLQEVLNPLALCAGAFPQLIPPVVTILQSCAQAGGPLIKSGPARDPDLQASAIAAFKQLIHRKLLHGRPPPLPSLE
ncbi:hypothetical protein M758_7G002500 [Ceratodon purpureus]|nr:hypothetical protein M758_7G002500 [Ceratodon purpureus]